MDRNFFLALALSFGILALWSFYMGERHPPAAREARRPVAEEPSVAPATEGRGPTPERGVESRREPSVPLREEAAVPKEERTFENAVFRVRLSSAGGGIERVALKHYRVSRDPDAPPVVLTTFDPERELGFATPFTELGLGDQSRAPYRLVEEADGSLRFERTAGGVTLRKVYTFEPDSYLLRFRIEVENRSDRVISPTFEVRWPARAAEGPDFANHGLIALHAGSTERVHWAVGGAGPACGRGGGSFEEKVFRGDVDWAGEEARYFLAVAIPENPREAIARFVPGATEKSGVAVLAYPPTALPPGQALSRQFEAYLGPKDPRVMPQTGARLDVAINQGWAWVAPLTRFFSWLLHASYSIVPNYGVAIILLTILVRVVTAPLMTRQMRSMKRMQEMQPRLQEIQEKYKDDRQKQQEEMMRLWRETGFNPVAGCLPMLLQFPVFIGLYYALQSSIDLRQAPFILWIEDLSRPETLFVIPGLELPVRVLPLLMGGSMILQQKLSPTTVDPAQARMMMTVMPVMFTLLFYQFPSGLVLYWLLSNLAAVAHQLIVNRGMQPAHGQPAGPAERKGNVRRED